MGSQANANGQADGGRTDGADRRTGGWQGGTAPTLAANAGSQAHIFIWRMPARASAMRRTRVSLQAIMCSLADLMRTASHRLMGTSSSTTASPAKKADFTCGFDT
jgi:hypothetical protein